ncbi:MAG: hypothetical protein IJX24_03750, partial [Oscillospiraceae bacterium]|nr:hypothetical protein [Oscillospiraceae bacterium]
RLLLEGAIVLYEGDALPLYEQADDQQEAKAAFSHIGKALYLMLEHMRLHMDLQATSHLFWLVYQI